VLALILMLIVSWIFFRSASLPVDRLSGAPGMRFLPHWLSYYWVLLDADNFCKQIFLS
jgi:hypothetical protein